MINKIYWTNLKFEFEFKYLFEILYIFLYLYLIIFVFAWAHSITRIGILFIENKLMAHGKFNFMKENEAQEDYK